MKTLLAVLVLTCCSVGALQGEEQGQPKPQQQPKTEPVNKVIFATAKEAGMTGAEKPVQTPSKEATPVAKLVAVAEEKKEQLPVTPAPVKDKLFAAKTPIAEETKTPAKKEEIAPEKAHLVAAAKEVTPAPADAKKDKNEKAPVA